MSASRILEIYENFITGFNLLVNRERKLKYTIKFQKEYFNRLYVMYRVFKMLKKDQNLLLMSNNHSYVLSLFYFLLKQAVYKCRIKFQEGVLNRLVVLKQRRENSLKKIHTTVLCVLFVTKLINKNHKLERSNRIEFSRSFWKYERTNIGHLEIDIESLLDESLEEFDDTFFQVEQTYDPIDFVSESTNKFLSEYDESLEPHSRFIPYELSDEMNRPPKNKTEEEDISIALRNFLNAKNWAIKNRDFDSQEDYFYCDLCQTFNPSNHSCKDLKVIDENLEKVLKNFNNSLKLKSELLLFPIPPLKFNRNYKNKKERMYVWLYSYNYSKIEQFVNDMINEGKLLPLENEQEYVFCYKCDIYHPKNVGHIDTIDWFEEVQENLPLETQTIGVVNQEVEEHYRYLNMIQEISMEVLREDVFFKNVDKKDDSFSLNFPMKVEWFVYKEDRIRPPLIEKLVFCELLDCGCSTLLCDHKNQLDKMQIEQENQKTTIQIEDEEVIDSNELSKRLFLLAKFQTYFNQEERLELMECTKETFFSVLNEKLSPLDKMDLEMNRLEAFQFQIDEQSKKKNGRFLFDSNIFISHNMSNSMTPTIFSWTVFNEILKLNKKHSSFLRFIRFFFSQPNVFFPERKFPKTYGDDNIIIEAELYNATIVTNDRNLRSKYTNSLSYTDYVRSKPKLIKPEMSMTPLASKEILGTINLSYKPITEKNGVAYIVPFFDEEFSNEFCEFVQNEKEIDLDLSFDLEMDPIPISFSYQNDICDFDIGSIEHYNREILDRIDLQDEYKVTKNEPDMYPEYKRKMIDYAPRKLKDEIFPITSDIKDPMNSFKTDLNLRSKAFRKKDYLFFNDLGIKTEFPKKTENVKKKSHDCFVLFQNEL